MILALEVASSCVHSNARAVDQEGRRWQVQEAADAPQPSAPPLGAPGISRCCLHLSHPWFSYHLHHPPITSTC